MWSSQHARPRPAVAASLGGVGLALGKHTIADVPAAEQLSCVFELLEAVDGADPSLDARLA